MQTRYLRHVFIYLDEKTGLDTFIGLIVKSQMEALHIAASYAV